jgi:hypothetical protein
LPSSWRRFDAPIDGSGLERFESDAGIAKIVEPELIEVVRPDVGRKALRPIILDALVNNRVARLERLDPIRAGTEWRLQRRLRDVVALAGFVHSFPPISRQDRQLPQDLRQLADTRRIEGEPDLVFADLLGLHDVAVIGCELRVQLPEGL